MDWLCSICNRKVVEHERQATMAQSKLDLAPVRVTVPIMMENLKKWSEWQDLNLRPLRPERTV